MEETRVEKFFKQLINYLIIVTLCAAWFCIGMVAREYRSAPGCRCVGPRAVTVCVPKSQLPPGHEKPANDAE